MQAIVKDDTVVITKPEDDFLDRLLAWDLTTAMARVRKNLRLPENEYAELELEYKRYMTCVVMKPNQRMTPSELIDEVWHAHILHTEDYFSFCRAFNSGRYIHHRPETNAVILHSNQADNLMPRYRDMFGEPNRKFWPQNEASMCDGQGTGCESCPRSMGQSALSMCDGDGGGTGCETSTAGRMQDLASCHGSDGETPHRMRAMSMCDGQGGEPDAGDDQ